jgi:hypothetical protein
LAQKDGLQHPAPHDVKRKIMPIDRSDREELVDRRNPPDRPSLT